MKVTEPKASQEPVGIVISGFPRTPPPSVFTAYVWGPAPNTPEDSGRKRPDPIDRLSRSRRVTAPALLFAQGTPLARVSRMVGDQEWQDQKHLLLGHRISDLGLAIQGTRVERLVERLYEELAARELRFRP